MDVPSAEKKRKNDLIFEALTYVEQKWLQVHGQTELLPLLDPMVGKGNVLSSFLFASEKDESRSRDIFACDISEEIISYWKFIQRRGLPKFPPTTDVGVEFVETDPIHFLAARSYEKFKVEGYMIYVNPPYVSDEEFNHGQFWNVMRSWSERNLVIICERNAPADFKKIWSQETYFCNSSQKQYIESLFVHETIAKKINM